MVPPGGISGRQAATLEPYRLRLSPRSGEGESRPKGGGRGAGIDATQDFLIRIHVHACLCHDSEAALRAPPPPPFGRSPSPLSRVRMNENVSRRDRVRVLRKPVAKNVAAGLTFVREAGGGDRLHHDQCPASQERKKERKRKRNAGRRKFACSASCDAAPPPPYPPRLRGREREGAARLPAFHRGSCQRNSRIPTAQLGPGFRAERRADQAGGASPRRRRPRFAAMHSHAGQGAGRHDAQAARVRGDEPPPAGTALAPPAGVAGWRPLRERDWGACSRNGDGCQEESRCCGDALSAVIRGLDPLSSTDDVPARSRQLSALSTVTVKADRPHRKPSGDWRWHAGSHGSVKFFWMRRGTNVLLGRQSRQGAGHRSADA